ncbi:MAG: glutaredoxin family protein [Candidatus Brennerbacteria bacterium]|nr:glutaredoxin family protein [Candidatus Brennerbacteria bacterium]
MKNVIIYTTPTCVYCRMAKAFFAEKKVPYTEHDVVTDLKAREEMVQKSGQLGVPVIEIGSAVIVGFDRDAIVRALEIQ